MGTQPVPAVPADIALSAENLYGLSTNRPAASKVPPGTHYFSSDTGEDAVSDGVSTWTDPASATVAGAAATSVTGPPAFGSAPVVGTDDTFARAGHVHGLPAAPQSVPTPGAAGHLLISTGSAAGDYGWDGNGGTVVDSTTFSGALTADSFVNLRGSATVTNAGAAIQVAANGRTSGALPTVAFTSGAGQELDASTDRHLVVPLTLSPTTVAAATVKVELSPDGVTYSTLGTWTQPAAGLTGQICLQQLAVPAMWYVRFTATNATIGTGTYW